MAAAEMALGFHVSDYGFDGGAASQLAFDSSEDAAFWPKMTRRGCGSLWPRHPLSTSALGLTADELLGIFDDRSQRVAIIRIAGQRSGVQHELAAESAGVGRDDRDFDAELVRG
jgi:hypothetical protein